MTAELSLTVKSNFSGTNFITERMFGANLLFRFDLLSGPASVYATSSAELGISSIRYPGGSMTEFGFDINNPDGPPLNTQSGASYVGISEFLQFADVTNRAVDIVLPTRRFYSGSPFVNEDRAREINFGLADDFLNFIRKLVTWNDSGDGALPDTAISTIELGNEYWGAGNMTAVEYGRLINYIVPKIEDIFSELGITGELRPKIIVQMGDPLDDQFKIGMFKDLKWIDKVQLSNEMIASQIVDPKAVNAIDGLVRHYYFRNTEDIFFGSAYSVDMLTKGIKTWEDAGFKDKDYYITEWNVSLYNPEQLGLKGASTIIEQFSYMVEAGVDAAFAWPLLGYNSGLFQKAGAGWALTPIGAAFKLMSESLVGTRMLPYELHGGRCEIETYGSDKSIVVFVSSRDYGGQDISVPIGGLVDHIRSVAATKIGVASGTAVNDPNASAVLLQLDPVEFMVGKTIQLHLDPFEVVQIVFDIQVGKRVDGSQFSDRLRGGDVEDTLFGYQGRDSIDGGAGNDIIGGGLGADLLRGGEEHDTIMGGDGNDVMFGGLGNDLLKGGNGGDTVFGLGGDDRLFGRDGNDVLYGGFGKDTLNGGIGNDLLTGGDGVDTFVFGPNGGHDLITDFTPRDVLDLTNWHLGARTASGESSLPSDWTLLASTDADGALVLTFGNETLTLQGLALGSTNWIHVLI